MLLRRLSVCSLGRGGLRTPCSRVSSTSISSSYPAVKTTSMPISPSSTSSPLPHPKWLEEVLERETKLIETLSSLSSSPTTKTQEQPKKWVREVSQIGSRSKLNSSEASSTSSSSASCSSSSSSSSTSLSSSIMTECSSIQKLLQCHTEVCTQAGHIELARRTVLAWRRHWTEMNAFPNEDSLEVPSVINANLMSVLFSGLRSDVENDLQHLWASFDVDNEKQRVDLQGLLHVWHHIGLLITENGSEAKHTELKRFGMDRVVSKMKSEDIAIADLFSNEDLIVGLGLSKNKLIEAVRLVEPNFVIGASIKASNLSQGYEKPLFQEFIKRGFETRKTPLTSFDKQRFLRGFPQALQKQLSRETENAGIVSVPSILAEDESTIEAPSPSSSLSSAEDLTSVLLSKWHSCLRSKFRDLVSTLTSFKEASVHESHTRPFSVAPFLQVLPEEAYVDIMMAMLIKVVTLSEVYSPMVKAFQFALGHAVMVRFQIGNIVDDPETQKHYLDAYKEYVDRVFDDSSSKENQGLSYRNLFLDCCQKRGLVYFQTSMMADWQPILVHAVGRELIKLILRNITVDIDSDGALIVGDQSVLVKENVESSLSSVNRLSVRERTSIGSCSSSPAIFKVIRLRDNMMEAEELKPHPLIAALFGVDRYTNLRFAVHELPMLVPPVPWVADHSRSTPFLLRPTDLMRVMEEDHWRRRQTQPQLEPVLDSLNLLGNTAWTINNKVLDVLSEVFRNPHKYEQHLSDMAIARAPHSLTPPVLDSSVASKLSSGSTLGTEEERQLFADFLARKSAFQQIKSECASMWCTTLYQLSVANLYRDKVFFFPHNMDFRGRVYPVAPHLHHMGCDLVRSTLKFADGKRLGKTGLEWLKIHIVNLTGSMKRDSVATRLSHAEILLPEVLDSAQNPLTGRMWWLKANKDEDPWQVLAACIELDEALKCPEGPENFISHLPVHQDGSCNGLQHYAALGRDELGAAAVNVLPAEAPQDVYSQIAAVVERKRLEASKKADGAKDKKTLQKAAIAKALENQVFRKTIKQTVMTTVYGVTKFGAREQIRKKLKDQDGFPYEMANLGAAFLTEKVFESLDEMFAASQDIQAWFTECANVCSKILKVGVEWETPLGLVVRQPYRKRMKGGSSNVSLTSTSSNLSKNTKTMPLSFMNIIRHHRLQGGMLQMAINPLKQRNAFPPNFVHSLDSSHMMLTALHMHQQGYVFASIHDCYWTHAANVDTMNAICREQFIELHMQPLLQKLSRGLLQLLEEHRHLLTPLDAARAERVFKAVPAKGKLQLEKVKDSVYFFS